MAQNERQSSFHGPKDHPQSSNTHSTQAQLPTRTTLHSQKFTSHFTSNTNTNQPQIVSLKIVPNESVNQISNEKGRLKSLHKGKLSNNRNDTGELSLLNEQCQRSFSCKENILIKKLQQISTDLKRKKQNNLNLASQNSELQAISKKLWAQQQHLSERLSFYQGQRIKKENDQLLWNQTHNNTRQKLFQIFNKDAHQF